MDATPTGWPYGCSNLPYDSDDPPERVPGVSSDRLLWQVARRLFADHQPGADGFCQVCRPHEFYPCLGRQLADLGLRSAARQRDLEPWRRLGVSAMNRRDRQRWLLRAPMINPVPRADDDGPDGCEPGPST